MGYFNTFVFAVMTSEQQHKTRISVNDMHTSNNIIVQHDVATSFTPSCFVAGQKPSLTNWDFQIISNQVLRKIKIAMKSKIKNWVYISLT